MFQPQNVIFRGIISLVWMELYIVPNDANKWTDAPEDDFHRLGHVRYTVSFTWISVVTWWLFLSHFSRLLQRYASKVEKLIVAQLVKKINRILRSPKFCFRRRSLTWARWIQSTHSRPTSLRPILILSSHLLVWINSVFNVTLILLYGYDQYARKHFAACIVLNMSCPQL
jgi:hypothetical protein